MSTSTSSLDLGQRVSDLLSIGYSSSQITILLDCTAAEALDALAAYTVANGDLDEERAARDMVADRRYRDYLDGDDFQHRHDLIESATTDECTFGCKVFSCSCGESEVRHMGSYGCPIGRGVSA